MARGGRASFRLRQEQAAKARSRMARRAKRARFFKEQKKRIMIGFVCFLLLVFAVFFTPFGPDWYYGKIQLNKFASPGVVNEGAIRDLYKLGVFYSWTMRKNQAMETFDEISTAYYGFTFSQFAANPEQAWDKRFASEKNVAKGRSIGPPFKISDVDLPYIGLAIHEAAFIMKDSGRSKQFAKRLFRDLYIGDFYENHPEVCDQRTYTIMKNMAAP